MESGRGYTIEVHDERTRGEKIKGNTRDSIEETREKGEDEKRKKRGGGKERDGTSTNRVKL